MPEITNQENPTPPPYGGIRSVPELGRLFRAERKRQGLTLEQLYASTGLSTRFLSEFERGKPNVSLVRVIAALQALGLELLVLPRSEAATLMGQRRMPRAEPTERDR
jgi:transcriptional regulator with XRE-family HTH domain